MLKYQYLTKVVLNFKEEVLVILDPAHELSVHVLIA